MILTVTLNPAIDKVAELKKLKKSSLNRIKVVSILPGGKGINVARGVASFGGKVTATGFIGGYNGKYIVDYLIREEIEPHFFPIEGESRVCLIILQEKGVIAEIYEEGPVIDNNSAESYLSFFQEISAKFNFIAISGNIPNSLPDNYLPRLIEPVQANLFLDVTGKPLLDTLSLKNIYFLKLNQKEFYETFTIKNNDLENQMFKIASYYSLSNLIITLGEEGVLVYHKKKLYRSYCEKKVLPLNPIGAGDSLMGTLIYHLSSGESFLEACKKAVAASISNTTLYEGGRINFTVYNDVLKYTFLEKIG